MPIEFTCPTCLAKLRLRDEYAGECGRCPHCKSTIFVPDLTGQISPPLGPDDFVQPETPAVESAGERVKFRCASCGTKMSAAASDAGRHVTCPSCRTKQPIPSQPRDSASLGTATAGAASGGSGNPVIDPSRAGQPDGAAGDFLSALANITRGQAEEGRVMPLHSRRDPLRLRTGSQGVRIALYIGAGTAVGLVLLCAVFFVPALMRERVLPDVRDKVAVPQQAAESNDPVERGLAQMEKAATQAERNIAVMRKIVNADSARQFAREWMDSFADLAESIEAGEEFRKLEEFQTLNIPDAKKEQVERLTARMKAFQADAVSETTRLRGLPEVNQAIAQAVKERLDSDPSSAFARLVQERRIGSGIDWALPKQNGVPQPTQIAPPPVAAMRPNQAPMPPPGFARDRAGLPAAPPPTLQTTEEPPQAPPDADPFALPSEDMQPVSMQPELTAQERIARAIADLDSGDRARARTAAEQLKNLVPNQERDKVASLLNEFLGDTSKLMRLSVAQALTQWGTRESIPGLAKLLDDPDVFTRRAAFEAIGNLHESTGAAEVARRLGGDDGQEAAQSLVSMGSVAEDAVLLRLDNADAPLQREICRVLAAIGTEKSLPPLKKLTKDKGVGVRPAAEQAQAAIKERATRGERVEPAQAPREKSPGVLKPAKS